MWIQLVLGLLCWLVPAPGPELIEETFADKTRIEYEARVSTDGTTVRDGAYRFYAADGTQRVEGKYQDGERTGRWIYSTVEGKTWIIGKYSKGLRHGSWSIKGQGKSIRAKGKYKWGVPTGEWTLLDSQGIERKGIFEHETTRYADGSLASEGPAFDGTKHGRWTFYWRNGRKQLEADYFDGERTGSWRFWHSDGSEDPEMLRKNYGDRWAVIREFYGDPIPELAEAQASNDPAAGPRVSELEPIDVPEAVEGTATPHALLRIELAKVLASLRTRDYSQPNAWAETQAYMEEALASMLCGHRLVPSGDEPGPDSTGLAIARLHSLYQLTENSPDFWFIDLNHTNHGKQTETCSLILHPTFLGDGLQGERNRRGVYALRFQSANRDLGKQGGAGTEESLELALKWLVENQEQDGAWLADDPFYSAGVTGLALLALIADGNTLREGPYQESVRRGVSFLLERPHPAFKWKPNRKRRRLPESLIPEEVSWVRNTTFLYTLAIMTQVYCELAATSDGPLIRQMAGSSSELCSRSRNPYAAWGYEMPGQNINDTSLTCWMVAALIAAERAGVEVNQAYREDSLGWFDEVTELMFGRAGYRAKDQLSSREVGVNEDYPRELTEALTAAALWTRFTLGQDPEQLDVMVRSADTLLRRLPEWDDENGYSNDCYYWYYGSYAMARSGGKHHKAWNKAIKGTLLTNQETIQEERGSWSNNGPWGVLGGRAYSTAMLALCLESYFRYDLSIR